MGGTTPQNICQDNHNNKKKTWKNTEKWNRKMLEYTKGTTRKGAVGNSRPPSITESIDMVRKIPRTEQSKSAGPIHHLGGKHPKNGPTKMPPGKHSKKKKRHLYKRESGHHDEMIQQLEARQGKDDCDPAVFYSSNLIKIHAFPFPYSLFIQSIFMSAGFRRSCANCTLLVYPLSATKKAQPAKKVMDHRTTSCPLHLSIFSFRMKFEKEDERIEPDVPCRIGDGPRIGIAGQRRI